MLIENFTNNYDVNNRNGGYIVTFPRRLQKKPVSS